jgi:osmoprotectant transport system ATP-binding protein
VHPTDVYVRFDAVNKSFGTTSVLNDFTLEIHRGEIFVLLGPSGCGKSTVLQLANRLLAADSGVISIDGSAIADTDPVALRRRIGYVIQQIGLFPHRTVADNIGTLCTLLRWPPDAVRDRVETLMELVGLPYAQYRGRYPHELSGGQQQRVGVARALAVDPPLLLMDEPFAALDPQIRRSLQREFRSWVDRLGTTVIFVSHDVDEALVVADRLGVMGARGQLTQVGTPLEILAEPADDAVRAFLGPERALKRLSVTPIDRSRLREHSNSTGPSVPATASLHEALLALLTEDASRVRVIDERGLSIGELSMADIGDQARSADVWS